MNATKLRIKLPTSAMKKAATHPLCLSPMRRIGLLVAWELLDPCIQAAMPGKRVSKGSRPSSNGAASGRRDGPQ